MQDGSENSKNGKESEQQVLRFPPTLAERDRLRKEKLKAERHVDDGAPAGPKPPPFFNFGHIPPFTKYIIMAMLLVHASLFLFAAPSDIFTAYTHFGFIPGQFSGAVPAAGAVAWLSPIIHIFLHGSWAHLAFNGVMALALGIFFERRFGTRRAALFFFACALGGAALTLILTPFSAVPVIGASGAVSGQFGAIILFFQRAQSTGRAPGRFGPWPVLGFWLLFMLLTGTLGGGIAWQAHIGGFMTGIALYLWMERKL